MEWKKIVDGIAAVSFVIGLILAIGLSLYLILTDAEYAKHNESVWALLEFLRHGGWIPLLMVFGPVVWFFMRD